MKVKHSDQTDNTQITSESENRKMSIGERSVWPILVHIVAKRGGRCSVIDAHSELKKAVPFTQDYLKRSYQSGDHKGQSVINHHWGFLRGQSNEKTSGWHDVMKPARETGGDSYELTEFGKAFALGIRPLVESYLGVLKLGKIEVNVKRSTNG